MLFDYFLALSSLAALAVVVWGSLRGDEEVSLAALLMWVLLFLTVLVQFVIELPTTEKTMFVRVMTLGSFSAIAAIQFGAYRRAKRSS